MANFASLSSLFGNLFSGKPAESVIGVDLGSSSIKVVQLRKKSGVPVLETYGELALGPYGNVEIGRATNLSAELVAKALNDVLREANVTATSAGFSIPFSSSLISLLELPQVQSSQLSQIIPLEARKYIPVPISEVTLDWFVIPQDEARYLSLTGDEKEKAPPKLNVLLVAIHNDILTKYKDIIKQTKLQPGFFEIEIFSAARAALEQGIAPVMVLDLGAATTKLYIVEYGIVRVSHNINKGGQDITLALSRTLGVSVTKAEEMKRELGLLPSASGAGVSETSLMSLEYIFSEANRVLLSYERRYNKNVSKVVLVGGGAIMKGLLDVSQKHFQTEVHLGNPFAKVEAPAFLEPVLRQAGPEFSVATGLALRKLSEQG